MMRFIVGLLSALVLQAAVAQVPPATAATPKKPHATGSSPFSAFTKSLPQDKKKPFMELMKRLRSAKNASGVDKDEKKKTMTGLDAQIHQLLGTEYKRYRSVSQAVKAEHVERKATKTGTPTATTAAAPAPVTGALAPKKKKGPGAGGAAKKVKPLSTTQG